MTTKTNTYNGWKNKETWAVKLWIDNDQATQERFLELAREIFNQAEKGEVLTKEQNARYELAGFLQDEYENKSYDMLASSGCTSTVFADLIATSLCRVNWSEVAESLLEDIKEINA